MKKSFIFLMLFLLVEFNIFLSCKKENSCNTCITNTGNNSNTNPGNNKQNRPPFANAGPDLTIFLPTDSIILNGTASNDPDNNIISYKWAKVYGPLTFSIQDTRAVKTSVTDLIQGFYQFELKVTDSGGLVSNDTIGVSVENGGYSEVTFVDLKWINYCYDSRPGVCAFNGDAPSYGLLIEDTYNVLPDSANAIIGVWVKMDNSNGWEQAPYNCWVFPDPYPESRFTYCLTSKSLSVFSWFMTLVSLEGRKVDVRVRF